MIKFFCRSVDGTITLFNANPQYPPARFPADDAELIGIVDRRCLSGRFRNPYLNFLPVIYMYCRRLFCAIISHIGRCGSRLNRSIKEVFNTMKYLLLLLCCSLPVAAATPRQFSFFERGSGFADYAVTRNGQFYATEASSPRVMFRSLAPGKVITGDYDGDLRSDIAVFNDGRWTIYPAGAPGEHFAHFGQAGDVPMSADFDGDGKTDIAVFRDGWWYVLRSSDGSLQTAHFGQAGDVPIAADYDGDSRADYAVFRAGDWYFFKSARGFSAVRFGLPTDKPVPADYDGDGQTDIAVFRDGWWYLLRTSEGFYAERFGLPGDVPVPANFQTGSAPSGEMKDDIAVFRDGWWYVRTSWGHWTRKWGQAGDVPLSLAP